MSKSIKLFRQVIKRTEKMLINLKKIQHSHCFCLCVCMFACMKACVGVGVGVDGVMCTDPEQKQKPRHVS